MSDGLLDEVEAYNKSVSEQVAQPNDAEQGSEEEVENEAQDAVETNEEPKEEPKEVEELGGEQKVEPEKEEAPDDGIISLGDEEPVKTEPTEQDGIIKSLNEEIARLKENKSAYASPEIEKLNEYVRGGGKVTKEFWELQTKDYSNIDLSNEQSALSVLKDKLKYEEGLDDTIINKIMRKNFPILSGRKEEDEYDDEEKDDELVDLMRQAKTALPELQDIQKKAQLPEADHHYKEESERVNNLYRAQSREAISDFSGVVIELDKDLKVRAPLSSETRKFVNSVVTEPQNQGDKYFRERYVTKEGKVDYNKFASEMQILQDFPDITRKIYQQGLKRGQKETVEAELLQKPQEKAETNKGGNSKNWIDDFANVVNSNS